MEIGKVVEANIQNQYIRVHLKTKTENIYIGMPCIIETINAKYYCIITNLFQLRDDMTLAMSFNNVNIAENIGYDNIDTNLDRPESMESYADITCLKILYKNGIRKAFKTIPERLAEVRSATQEDINQIYVEPLIKEYPQINIDAESRDINAISFQPDYFAFGYLASSNNQILLPIRMDKIVQRPLSVVGMTGSGKTVTIKNIVFRIISDQNHCLNTRMIIFDVQNEYIIKKAGRLDLGIYDMFPNKVKIITLDPENCRKMGIHDAHEFKVFEENILLEDILSALSNTDLTEKMESTLLSIYTKWEKNKSPTKGTFYDEIIKFYNDPSFAQEFQSEGTSYTALKRRLRILIRDEGALSQFIKKKNPLISDEKDTLEELLSELSSDYPLKKSYIIHFGKFGKISYVYEFIANILGRKIYTEYSEKNDLILEDGNTKYDQCVILLEEAHKFIKNGRSNASIFNSIAREMRKYGLTLFIVDQMPSKIDEEIMAQVNNRIIHRMSDEKDIESSLRGLDVKKWKNIISTLEDGESLCFGLIVENMPTLIKSFYGNAQKFKEFHGVSPSSSLIQLQPAIKNNIQLQEEKQTKIKSNSLRQEIIPEPKVESKKQKTIIKRTKNYSDILNMENITDENSKKIVSIEKSVETNDTINNNNNNSNNNSNIYSEIPKNDEIKRKNIDYKNFNFDELNELDLE